MKKLLFAILLTLPCVSISQVIVRNDSLTSLAYVLQHSESKIIYEFMPGEDTTQIFWKPENLSKYSDLKIKPNQVFKIYVGLKLSEVYKKRFTECEKAVNELDALIQDQNREIADFNKNEITAAAEAKKLYADLVKKSEQLQELKDKKTKWYNSPYLYLTIGFAGGVWLAK